MPEDAGPAVRKAYLRPAPAIVRFFEKLESGDSTCSKADFSSATAADYFLMGEVVSAAIASGLG